MKIIITAMLLLSTVWQASAIQYQKMSSWVAKAATAYHPSTMRKVYGAASNSRICAFLRIDDSDAQRLLSDNGCRIYDSVGNLYIADVPLCRLASLSEHPSVRRIEASRSCRVSMDTTGIVVNALPVYDGYLLPQAYTGRGVVVGVMDIGFDLTHPNFYDSTATRYRIGSFWDQLSPDTVGSAYPVGRSYEGSEVLLALRHSYDGREQTHGTHTLGIAAGSGYTSDYRGIAYESDICIVGNATEEVGELIDSVDRYKYTTATDALGFKYIFDYAASKGMPCVASFSEGYVVGLDREDSLYSAYLDSITGPGRIIVASAGNENQIWTYMHKSATDTEAVSFIYPWYKNAVYYLQGDGAFAVSMQAYTVPADTVIIECRNETADTLRCVLQLPVSGRELKICLSRYMSSMAPLRTVYKMEIECDTAIYAAGPVLLRLMGDGTDVTARGSSTSGFYNDLLRTSWGDAEMSHNVHAPAYFPSVIAVGSTIHRTSYTNYLGESRNYMPKDGKTGVRSGYSSVGPTLDGRIKPDVMAPGDNIISSYSSYYLEQHPDAGDISSDVSHFDFNGRTYAWNSNTGTSMATPVVAGAVALWLQAKPDLTPAQVIDVFRQTCTHPVSDALYPNNEYGYGQIDVYRGLLYLLGVDGIDGISTRNPSHVGISFSGGELVLHFDQPPVTPYRVQVFSLSGQLMSDFRFRSSDSEQRIALATLPSGVYVVQLSCTDVKINGSVLIRI